MVTGCRQSVTSATLRTVDCSGRPTFNSPKWTANVGIEQTLRLPGYKLVASADTQYRSSRYVGFDYTVQEHQTATFETNAELTLTPDVGQWSLQAYVRNLENTRYDVDANLFGLGQPVDGVDERASHLRRARLLQVLKMIALKMARPLVAAVAGGALAIAMASAALAQPMHDLVLRHATVVNPADGSLRRDVDVLVDGGRITAVSPAGRTAPAARRVVEARGEYVSPGFLDMHAHPLGSPTPGAAWS